MWWLFRAPVCHAPWVNKHEHAARLRAAIARRGVEQEVIAEAVGRGRRTITNWTSRSNPTMPSDRERAILRDLLGDYDNPGDPVEVAIFESELTEDRQYDVIGYYKRALREQRQEEVSEPVRSLRAVAKPGGLEPEEGALNEP